VTASQSFQIYLEWAPRDHLHSFFLGTNKSPQIRFKMQTTIKALKQACHLRNEQGQEGERFLPWRWFHPLSPFNHWAPGPLVKILEP